MTMTSQNFTIDIGQRRPLSVKVYDKDPAQGGVDITNLCTFSVVSSNPQVISITGALTASGAGAFANGIQVGTANISITATNASGTVTETDTGTVTVAPPSFMAVTYGAEVGP